MIRLPRLPKLPAARAGLAVLEPIGPDGSGISYRAWSPGEGQAATLWIDATRIEEDPVRAERLARQAFALERVRHPNLAEVLRITRLDDRLAIIERLDRRRAVSAHVAEPVGPSSPPAPSPRPGPSSVRRAVGEALQATRGLRALHEHGLAHGNLRPESLAVLDDGRVILTGLGRVPPPPEDPEAPGTSTFPEPSAVRQDLDALGRLLYERLTGTPAGPSPEPSVTPPPESINPRVPSAVSEFIRRLRIPADRGGFGAIAPAVAELERIVGAPAPGAFLPREELVEAYRSYASAYAEAPTARLLRTVARAFYGGTAALALLALTVGLTSLALGLVHLMLMTAAFGFLIRGARRGGPLFDRLRRFVLGGRGRDLATVAAAVVLGLAGLIAAGLLGIMIALAIVAAILAGAREALIDERLEQERREAIDRAATLLRDLRVHGLTEPAVRAFAIDHGGEHWAPLFLELFGFDAYREAARRRAVPAADRLLRIELLGRAIDALDARLNARRDERDRLVLADLEERRLRAAGIHELTARRRSWRIASALLARARAFEQGATPPGSNLAAELAAAVRNPEEILVEAEAGREPIGARLRRRGLALLDTLTGPRARLLVGLALLAGFLAWAHQNRLLGRRDITELIEAARTTDDLTEFGAALDARRKTLQAGAEAAEPLRLEIASGPLIVPVRHAGAGLAALILIGSALSTRRALGLGAIVAALIALVGPDLGLPLALSLPLALALALILPFAARRLP